MEWATVVLLILGFGLLIISEAPKQRQVGRTMFGLGLLSGAVGLALAIVMLAGG
jgi:Na+/phosphate symporter